MRNKWELLYIKISLRDVQNTIKFKNANLFLNVIVEHFPQTVPAQPYFRETGCVTGCVTAEIKTACSNGSCSILLTQVYYIRDND